jgi:esterase/lipase superfamily enzyme
MNDGSVSLRNLRPLLAASLAGMLMLTGACASAPLTPDSALDAAKVAISNADKAGAGEHANAELAEARARLTLADNAVNEEDMVVAERFARESQVQAELASARTEAAKAAAVNRDMERGTEAMTEEMQRAGDPR